jgi:hypothetical protein
MASDTIQNADHIDLHLQMETIGKGKEEGR